MSGAQQGEPSAWLWWAMLAGMLGTLVAPVLAVDVPPLADYPNHLARCFFLAFGASDPVLQRMFAARWDLIPNLAVDLILPPLMRGLPPFAAGRVVVALALLLPTTGAIALSRAVFGRRSLWQLGAGFVAYDVLFLTGFLNFQLSLGVALWGAAAWVALYRRPAFQVLAGAAFAMAAFVSHVFGLLFFLALIGSLEAAEVWRRGLGHAATWRFAAGRGAVLIAVIAMPAVFYVLSPLGEAAGVVSWQTLRRKTFYLLTPVLGYLRPAVAAGTALALVAPAAWWASRRRLLVAPLAWIAGPVLLVGYLVLPVGIKGAYWVDLRLVVMLGFLLFAATMPRALGRREAQVLTAALSALFLARMAYLTAVWAGSQQDVADVRAVLRPVPPGARVLVMDADHDQRQRDLPGTPASRVPGFGLPPAFAHYGAFALLDRQAFYSSAFTMRGQQPMVAQPAYAGNGDGGAMLPRDVAELAPNAAVPPDPANYLAGWPARFDFVLVLSADVAGDLRTLLPPQLTLVEQRGLAALFSVRP